MLRIIIEITDKEYLHAIDCIHPAIIAHEFANNLKTPLPDGTLITASNKMGDGPAWRGTSVTTKQIKITGDPDGDIQIKKRDRWLWLNQKDVRPGDIIRRSELHPAFRVESISTGDHVVEIKGFY